MPSARQSTISSTRNDSRRASAVEGFLYRKSFRQGLLTLLLWMVLTGGLLTLLLFFFDRVAGSSLLSSLNEMLRAFPEGMRRQLGLESFPDFSSFREYFSIAMQAMLGIGCIYATYLGTSSVVRYESDHSIVFLCAQPVSRTALVLSKLLAQLTSLMCYNLFVFLIAYQASMSHMQNQSAFLSALLQVMLSFILVEAVYLGLGTLLSVFLTHLSQAAGVALMLFIATLLFGVLSNIIPGLGWLTILSPYQFTAVYPMMEVGTSLSAGLVVGSISAVVVCTALACAWYHHRDLDI